MPSPGTILENVGRALPRHFRNEGRLLGFRVRENRGHMWNSGPTSEGAEATSEEPGARRERPDRPPPGSLGGSGHRDQQHRPEGSAGAPREGPASSREAARNGRDERNKTFLHYWDTARVRGSRTHRPRSFPKGFAPEPATSTEGPPFLRSRVKRAVAGRPLGGGKGQGCPAQVPPPLQRPRSAQAPPSSPTAKPPRRMRAAFRAPPPAVRFRRWPGSSAPPPPVRPPLCARLRSHNLVLPTPALQPCEQWL